MPDTIAPADTPFTSAEGRQVLVVNPADFPVQLSALPSGCAYCWNGLRQRFVCCLKG